MTKPYRTRTQDPAAMRTEATTAGDADGQKNYPKTAASGEPVADYFGIGAEAEANTAAAVHQADHLAETRTEHDRDVAEKTAAVVQDTARVEDDLSQVSAADHEEKAYKHLPVADRREPWPAWLRGPLLGVTALGTGAALAGALLELTSDEPYYVWGFCLAVTLAVVALGAFLAHLARDFEYNNLKPGQYTTGILPKVVLAIGALFAVLLMVALASIRGTAAEADAARQSRTDDSGLTVMLPETLSESEGPDQAITNQASNDEEEPLLPSVPAYAYGLLEGLLFMAAFGIEYSNYRPLAKQRQKASKVRKVAERSLRQSRPQLAQSCGQLMAALGVRADHDAGVLIAGEATQIHVLAVVSDYRRALLSRRPSSQGSDPFHPIDNENADTPVTHQVAERWGRDLQPSGLISDDAYDRMELDQLAPTALARGLATLAKVPERAKFTPVTWDPASITNVAPLGVKPAQQRTNNSNSRKPARSTAKRGNGTRQ